MNITTYNIELDMFLYQQSLQVNIPPVSAVTVNRDKKIKQLIWYYK
jgi:hypothetical protein